MEQAEKKPTTRDILLRTALSMYARDGLHGVSLRSISAASGSRNSAATHYHFKNKTGVIQALLEMIYGEIAEIAQRQGTPQKIRESRALGEVIRCGLMPLITLSRDVEWGRDAILFLSRLITEADAELAGVNNQLVGDFYQSAEAELARLLPYLPKDVRRVRLMFMSVSVFHGFADLGALAYTPFGDYSGLKDEILLDHLVTYLCHALAGPEQNIP